MTVYGMPGFEDHALPCERCGELVRIATRTPEEAAQVFACEAIAIFCHDCFDLDHVSPSRQE